MYSTKIENEIHRFLYKNRQSGYVAILPFFAEYSHGAIVQALNHLEGEGYIEYEHHERETLKVQLTAKGVIAFEKEEEQPKSETSYEKKSHSWIEYGILGTTLGLFLFAVALFQSNSTNTPFQASIVEEEANEFLTRAEDYIVRENKNPELYSFTLEVDLEERKKVLIACTQKSEICNENPIILPFVNSNGTWVMGEAEILFE